MLDQKKAKLESIEKEDDLNTAMTKLIDQAAKSNSERFHCAMEFKVKFPSWSGFGLSFPF